MHIDVPDAAKAELAETLQADAAFLAEQGLLDYSLLVGIHRLPPSMPPAQREARVEALAQGGYVSRDRQKVYFFGIIDVLETYSLRWQAQRAQPPHRRLLRALPRRRRRRHLSDDARRLRRPVLHVRAPRGARAAAAAGRELGRRSAARAAFARRTGGGRTCGSGGGACSCRGASRSSGPTRCTRIEELEEALRAAREPSGTRYRVGGKICPPSLQTVRRRLKPLASTVHRARLLRGDLGPRIHRFIFIRSRQSNRPNPLSKARRPRAKNRRARVRRPNGRARHTIAAPRARHM